MSGIEEVANEAGYYVAIFQSNDSYQREVENVRMLLSNSADGVIGCLALETSNFDHYLKLNQHNIPLVFYDRVSNEVESSKVFIDDFGAAFKACEHLISVGSKRIAHIAGNQNLSVYKDRLEGYKACLEKNNIEVDNDLICLSEILSAEEGREFALKLLTMTNPPNGLFCANDETAISAIQVAKDLNLKIPEDFAVVGFSNSPASTIIDPPLTTVDDHAFEMGQAAARLLIRQIEYKDINVTSEMIMMKSDLIIRESSQKTN